MGTASPRAFRVAARIRPQGGPYYVVLMDDHSGGGPVSETATLSELLSGQAILYHPAEGHVMSNSLWPNFSTLTPPRGLREMLYDAAGDIATQTKGAILFYVDTLGVSGTVKQVRHNCYLRVPKTEYTHLLFQVSTPVPGPWPATVTTPEGDKFPNIQDEAQLRAAIQQILQRERTKEIVLYLLSPLISAGYTKPLPRVGPPRKFTSK